MTENNLAIKFPELAEEWDVDKNDSRLPIKFTCGSNKKVWWKCSICGNEWQATINHRTNGRGCPECAKKNRSEKLSKKNLIPGKTDLATCYPDIADQWHTEKNGILTPRDVTSKSKKKVWWKCPYGHEYQMTIGAKTAQKQGCPVCSGKQVLEGFNDLKSQRPDIASQWDYAKNKKGPEAYTVHSGEKVFWLCEKNHSYLARIAERTGDEKHSSGCPYCAGKKVLQGFNDLATVRPELASEWDYDANGSLLPTDVTEFSLKRVHWICKHGHKWSSTVSGRSSGNGCPVCSNIQLLKGYNDITTLFPQVAAEWDYDKNATNPEDHIAGTHKKAWWKCSNCGNSWYASIKERTYGKNGCPRCTFYHKTSFPEQAILFYVRKHFPNSINAYKPEFLAPYELDIFIPELSLGIEYDGKAWHQDTNRDFIKSNKLAEQKISLIRMREYGLPPAPDGDYVVECESFNGNIKELSNRLKMLFQKIDNIHGISLDTDINVERDLLEIKATYEGTRLKKSLLYESPEILKEWNYQKNGNFTPDKVTPHSRVVVWWICSRCGKEWQQSIETKMRGGLLCESCSRHDAALSRMKDAAQKKRVKTVTDYPHLLKEWDFEANTGLDPRYVTYGSERKVGWICSLCGNHYSKMIKARTTLGQGCPICGKNKSSTLSP